MKTLLHHLCTCLAEGRIAVLASIIESSGSAPRSSGARMLVCQDGGFFGTIGGGALEGMALARARELLGDSVDHLVLHFDLTASQAAAAGMICGGRVEVLLQRITPERVNMDFFEKLHEQFRQGRSPLFLTLIPENGAPAFFMQSSGCQSMPGLPDAVRQALIGRPSDSGAPSLLKGKDFRLYAETLIQPISLYLAGGGHVALAVAHLAGFLGLDVVVIDDRSEFASSARFPQAREVRVIPAFAGCLGQLQATDFVVIVTRGHQFDKDVLVQALKTGAGYIGMIGSRRKRDAIYAALRAEGFSDADFRRVHCPIGLAIGGETPEEIALSILAEIQQVRYAKTV
jgi:xanthine dehydrogenase accessory factor